MTKIFFITVLFLALSARMAFGLVSGSQLTNQTMATVHSVESSSATSRISVEAMAQAHSVANTSSPWVGLGANYEFNQRVSLGLRGFVPMSQPVDQSTYSVQAYSRIFLRSFRTNEFFFEPDYALNFYKLYPFQSAGGAVGVLNHISQDIAVGASGGLETAHYVIDSVGLERTSNFVVYPKIGFISDFYF